MKKFPRIRPEVWFALGLLAACALLWPAYRLLNPHLVSYKDTLQLLEQGRVEEAAATAEEVAARIAGRPDLLQDLGARFVKAKRNDAALIFYRTAWESEPDNWDAFRTSVSLLWGQSSAATALAFYEENQIPGHRQDQDLLLLEARLLVANDRPQEALQLLPEDLRETTLGKEIRARALAAMEQENAAVLLWRELLETDPENSEWRLEMARALAFPALREARQILAVNRALP